MMQPLADHTHPIVIQTADRLTAGAQNDRDRLERLFLYVRDGILFGFPAKGDLVPASETIETGIGQCNTKATLFLALCRAVGIPARIHFSLISRDIQKGFFRGIGYWLMPREISHAWVEVQIDGTWRRIDSFINDMALHRAAEDELAHRGWNIGFSLALGDGPVVPDLQLDQEAFVQMTAVTGDHGTWQDPAAYYESAYYRNRPGALRLWVYRLLIAGVNRRVAGLRDQTPHASSVTVYG